MSGLKENLRKRELRLSKDVRYKIYGISNAISKIILINKS